MTFEQYLQSLGYYQVADEDGNLHWVRDTDDGRSRLSGETYDGLHDQWNAIYNYQFHAGDQVGVGNGVYYWYPAGQGWENNPGIPSGALHYYAGGTDPYGRYLPEGWLVDKAPMDAVHPGDNELLDFAKAATIAFGAGYALSTFVLPSIGTSVADTAPGAFLDESAGLTMSVPDYGSVVTPEALDESAGLITEAADPVATAASQPEVYLDESAGLNMESPFPATTTGMPDISSLPSAPSLPSATTQIATKAAAGAVAPVTGAIIKAITSGGSSQLPGYLQRPGSLPGQYLTDPLAPGYGVGQNPNTLLVLAGVALLGIALMKRKSS